MFQDIRKRIVVVYRVEGIVHIGDTGKSRGDHQMVAGRQFEIETRGVRSDTDTVIGDGIDILTMLCTIVDAGGIQGGDADRSQRAFDFLLKVVGHTVIGDTVGCRERHRDGHVVASDRSGRAAVGVNAQSMTLARHLARLDGSTVLQARDRVARARRSVWADKHFSVIELGGVQGDDQRSGGHR